MRSGFGKCLAICLVVILLLGLVGCAGGKSPEQKAGTKAEPVTIRLMTGPQGGSWYPLGGAMAEVIEKNIPSVKVVVQPGAGITNVKAVEEGKAEMGFGNANSTVDAVMGREPFEKPATNVKHLMALYPQYFQIVVPADSAIDTIADLKGKSIATQPKGNTGEQMTRDVLEVYGLSYKDMAKVHFVSYSDAVELMKNRQTDAFFLVTTVPASSVMELAVSRKIKLINLPDDKLAALQKKNSGYVKRVIPANTYSGVNNDVQGIGTYTHLVGSAKLSPDLVEKILKVLVDNLDRFGAVVKDMKGVKPKDLAADIGGVPLHPGAERFFKSLK